MSDMIEPFAQTYILRDREKDEIANGAARVCISASTNAPAR